MGDGGRYDSLTDVAAYVHQQFKAREQILFFYTGYPADGPFSELTAEEAAAAYSKSEKQLAADGTVPCGYPAAAALRQVSDHAGAAAAAAGGVPP